MITKVSFIEWLQQFDSALRIMENDANMDIDVLYWGEERLCSVPKGLGGAKGWSKINDSRKDAGYQTSDGIAHRSLSGIGLILLGRNIINEKQFVKHFMSQKQKELMQNLARSGARVKTKSGLII